MIRDWCETQGVQVFTGTRVEAIEPGTPLKVRLSNGQTVEADLVISATGVKPNIGFLENSGITCLQGVLTDEHLQTSVPGIYAAGDCAEAFDKVSGTTIVSAIQPNAAEQARVAALNMVGAAGRTEGRDADQRARHAGPDFHQLWQLAGRAGRRPGRADRPPGQRRQGPAPEPAVQGRRAGGLQQRRLDRPCGRDARAGRRRGAPGPLEGQPASATRPS